jgi:PAS domain S-box-containing protein
MNTRISRWIGVLLLGAFLSNPLSAQLSELNDDWRWVRFDTFSGLPSLEILEILELPSGVPWVQLRAGLAWYDGFQWQAVPLDSAVAHSVFRARMSAEANTVLLVISPALYRVSSTGAVRLVPSYNGSPLAVQRAYSIPGEGIMLQCDTSLYLYKGDTTLFIPSPYQHRLVRVPDSPYGLLQTDDRVVWLDAPLGLFRWDHGHWKLWQAFQAEEWSGIQTLVQNARGDGHLSARLRKGRVNVEWSRGKITHTEIVTPTIALTVAGISPTGSIIAEQSSGVYIIYGEGRWHALSTPPAQVLNARVFRFRRNGDLWVGKDDGLFLCSVSSRRWTMLPCSFSPATRSVNDLVFDRDSTLWVGTSDGILHYHRDGSSEWIREAGDVELGIVTARAQDRDGNIWASSGTSFTGAVRWDGNHWKHFGRAEGFTNSCVHKITTDQSGRLWFLTISTFAPGARPETEEGAICLDNGTFTKLGGQNGSIDHRVYCFVEDTSGAYWFGGLQGLSRLKNGIWKRWTEADGLRSNKVFTVAVDRSDRLWFGHQQHGLGYIDQHDTPHYVTATDGMASRTIWNICAGPGDILWVATRDGLFVNNAGIWAEIGTSQGLSSPYIWPLLATDERIYIGTAGAGVAVLNYSLLQTLPPRARFEDPVIRGNSATVSWRIDAHWELTPSSAVKIRYHLDDQPWSEWSDRRSVTLSRLGTGSHTLTVQPKGVFGQISRVHQAVTFEIQPPLYLRPMIYIPLLLLLGIVMSLVVTTVRRKREYDRSLRERDALFRAVVEHQTEFILRAKLDGTITFVNEAFCRLVQKSREQVTRFQIRDLLPHDNGSTPFDQLLTPPSDGGQVEMDDRFLTADGTLRWLRWTSSPIPSDQGSIAEIQIIGRDITERKAAEDNLVRSEERYRIVAEQTGQVVYEHDVPSGAVAWLGAISDVTGYSLEEFASVNLAQWQQMIHEGNRKQVSQDLAYALATGGYYQTTYRFRRKSGEYIDIFENGVVLPDGQGKPSRRLGTMTDVTERRRSEALIAASLKEKEVLLKEIHHRVKNNLQVISSLLSLQTANVHDPQTIEQLRESQNRIRSMALIHERLYQSNDLARIDFGEYVRSLVNFLVRSYGIPNVHLKLAVQNIEMSVNTAIPCGLIINELVSNALKHAFPAGRGGEVEISVEVRPDGIGVLRVSDNGIGLPSDIDVDNTNTLGLQLVNTLSNQLNGKIELFREPGTTYSIAFPVEVQ